MTPRRVVGPLAIVLTTLGLHAVVGGNDVTNLVVTEVYAEVGEAWALAGMSVTRLVTH